MRDLLHEARHDGSNLARFAFDRVPKDVDGHVGPTRHLGRSLERQLRGSDQSGHDTC